MLTLHVGPYAPAILRFHISFPPDYPTLPPSITFISDIFHPLVAPLTTYTYTTGSSNSDTVSATDEERLPPGGFSLRHGFPHWFGRSQKSITTSTGSSRNVSGSQKDVRRHGEDAYIVPPPEDVSSRRTSDGSQSSHNRVAQSLPHQAGSQFRSTSIREVLQYMKHSFDDEAALDTLPLDAAGNSGAWKAWRAHCRSNKSDADIPTLGSSVKQQDEWSWDGVWEMRVRKGIDASIAESTLYGGVAGGDDLVSVAISYKYDTTNGMAQIRFLDVGDDLIQEIKEGLMSSVDRS